jgi:hypothetical protein
MKSNVWGEHLRREPIGYKRNFDCDPTFASVNGHEQMVLIWGIRFGCLLLDMQQTKCHLYSELEIPLKKTLLEFSRTILKLSKIDTRFGDGVLTGSMGI